MGPIDWGIKLEDPAKAQIGHGAILTFCPTAGMSLSVFKIKRTAARRTGGN
jgi:hypothetical protein